MTKNLIIFLILFTAKICLSNQNERLEAKIKQEKNEIIVKISKNNQDINTEKEIIYLIKKGDTLSKIALRYKKSIKKIAKDNNIRNINLIITGKSLILK